MRHLRHLTQLLAIRSFFSQQFLTRQLVFPLRSKHLFFKLRSRKQRAVAMAPGVVGNLEKGDGQHLVQPAGVAAHPFAAHKEGSGQFFGAQKIDDAHIAAGNRGLQFAKIESQRHHFHFLRHSDSANDAHVLSAKRRQHPLRSWPFRRRAVVFHTELFIKAIRLPVTLRNQRGNRSGFFRQNFRRAEARRSHTQCHHQQKTHHSPSSSFYARKCFLVPPPTRDGRNPLKML